MNKERGKETKTRLLKMGNKLVVAGGEGERVKGIKSPLFSMSPEKCVQWLDLEHIMLSEISQRKTNTI